MNLVALVDGKDNAEGDCCRFFTNSARLSLALCIVCTGWVRYLRQGDGAQWLSMKWREPTWL